MVISIDVVTPIDVVIFLGLHGEHYPQCSRRWNCKVDGLGLGAQAPRGKWFQPYPATVGTTYRGVALEDGCGSSSRPNLEVKVVTLVVVRTHQKIKIGSMVITLASYNDV